MAQMAEKMLLNEDNKWMIMQCATFSKSLNPRNINKSVSDIRFRIRFPFQSRFWISVSGCKLTILPDIQPANRIVIISDVGLLIGANWSAALSRNPKRTVHKCIMTTLGLRCARHAGTRIIRRFKSHTVSEICTVVFVWHTESVRLYAVGGLAVSTISAAWNACDMHTLYRCAIGHLKCMFLCKLCK